MARFFWSGAGKAGKGGGVFPARPLCSGAGWGILEAAIYRRRGNAAVKG